MKRGSTFSRWMKTHPATPRRSPELEQLSKSREALGETIRLATLKECPAMRHGQDQVRCPQCGVTWGVDEERPPCQSTGEAASNRSRGAISGWARRKSEGNT